MSTPLIALTCYYNPFHGTRRRHNYHVFRENLDVPLVTVEWSRDGRFDLAEGDADLMIRVTGGDLMWQKERLLNRGLARIRKEGLARDVAIIDADVVFDTADWVQRVSQALGACPLVNCQTHIDYLSELPGGVRSRAQLLGTPCERTISSFGYAIAQGESPFRNSPQMAHDGPVGGYVPPSGIAGMAIAVRLTALPHFELYDANIVGGGDHLMVSAAAGKLQEFFDNRRHSPMHQADARAWAARCLPTQPERLRFGYADNRVMHLWHGKLEQRQYRERLEILGTRGYDPAKDIDRSGEALRFAEGAVELKAAVGQYLLSRDDA